MKAFATGMTGLLLLASTSFAGVQYVAKIPAAHRNSYYPSNRTPLLPSPVVKLPPGAIKPAGWLDHILVLEARGFVGHLDEISTWCDYKTSAWVHPDGIGDNGFEEVPYWLRGLGDLGCVTGDEHVIQKAKKWLEGVMSTARPDGYFGPASNLHSMPGGLPDLWPNMPVIQALRSYYEYSHDPRVIKLLTNYFHWMSRQNDKVFTVGWGTTRWSEDLESLYWLYNRTGDKSLLSLANRIEKPDGWVQGVASIHGVNFGEGYREPAEFYMQSRKKKFLEDTIHDFELMNNFYGQVPGGGYGADENGRFGFAGPRQGMETCAIVENMASFEELQHITGSPAWADRCEDLAFNMLPSASTPKLTAIHYLTAPNQVELGNQNMHPYIDDSGNMFAYSDSGVFRCCEHNFGYGWPYFAEALWAATSDNGAAAMMYSACTATIKAGDGSPVTITETTDYPFRGTVEIKFASAKPDAFPLYLRVPFWCRGTTASLNGKALNVRAAPDTFIRIDRPWKNGDTVTLHFPMRVRVHIWKRNKHAASVAYGPLNFSLDVGEKWQSYGTYRGTKKWEVFPTTSWNYGLVLNKTNPAASFKVNYRPGPVAGQPFTPETAPLELTGTGREIPEWKTNADGIIGSLHPSPVISTEPDQSISMIPMGAARLRVSMLPVIATSSEKGHCWVPPAKMIARVFTSWTQWPWVPRSVMYSTEPASSRDQYVPAFTWQGQPGSNAWIEYIFPKPVEITSSSVYWFSDQGRKNAPYPDSGNYRQPASWSLQYNQGDGWKTITPMDSTYGTALNRYNRVAFKPLTVMSLRLAVNFRDGHPAGLYRWKLFDHDLQLVPTVSSAAAKVLESGSGSIPVSLENSPITLLNAENLNLLADGEKVHDWRDQSYGGFDAHAAPGCNVPTFSKNGVNGHPALQFNADDRQLLVLPRPVQNDFTIAVVFQTRHPGPQAEAFFQGAGIVQGEVAGVVPDFGISINSRGQVLAGTGDPDTTISSSRDYADGRPHLAVFERQMSSGRITLYLDGKEAASANAGTESLTAPDTLGLGGQNTGANFYTGDICEVEFFDRNLNAEQRLELEKKLMTQWGIQAGQ
jgi:Beta-L-arabinofuranosidase, GH127 catalytic domain/Beta-L-arabinofuranosidase, GH127 middle domain/Concanavalin A-like lectin/glucanases superfamily